MICILWAGFFFIFPVDSSFAGISQDQKRIKDLEEQVRLNSKRLDLLERVSFSGDFRLRYEGINNGGDNEAGGTTDSTRGRFRFRLAGMFHLRKNLDVGFRVSSGGTGPTTTNDNFDRTASFKDFKINRAYVAWSPDNFKFQGGKFEVPFFRSEMIWAVDINVEGFSQQMIKESGDTKMKFTLGQFIVEDNGLPTEQPLDDTYLLAGQVKMTQNAGFGDFIFCLTYYDFKNLQGVSVTDDQGLPGNSQNTKVGGLVANDFNVLDAMVQFKTHVMGQPISIFGEYSKNIATDVDLDTSWEMGFQYGNVDDFGDWRLRAFYRLTQFDSVFSAWNSADFHAGGTNSKGLSLQLHAVVTRGMVVSLSQFFTREERGAKFERERTYADLVFKF